jgi:hypothetical protein
MDAKDPPSPPTRTVEEYEADKAAGINSPPYPPRSTRRIFVFGSNLAGRHGKGAALAAKKLHGAIQGRGEGPQGRSYAIPTKDAQLKVLPLPAINASVQQFLAFAAAHPELSFEVTAIGTGLAGYTPQNIAPMFRFAPANVHLPEIFVRNL